MWYVLGCRPQGQAGTVGHPEPDLDTRRVPINPFIPLSVLMSYTGLQHTHNTGTCTVHVNTLYEVFKGGQDPRHSQAKFPYPPGLTLWSLVEHMPMALIVQFLKSC